MDFLFSIREFKKGDEKQIREVYYRSVHSLVDVYSQEQLDAWCHGNHDLSLMRKSLKENISCVAESEEGVIVGFGEMTKFGKGIGYLERLFVDPEFFGFGIGSSILRKLEGDAMEQKIHRISLDSSLSAKRFYERNGYSFIASSRVSIGRLKLDSFLMSKEFANKGFFNERYEYRGAFFGK